MHVIIRAGQRVPTGRWTGGAVISMASGGCLASMVCNGEGIVTSRHPVAAIRLRMRTKL